MPRKITANYLKRGLIISAGIYPKFGTVVLVNMEPGRGALVGGKYVFVQTSGNVVLSTCQNRSEINDFRENYLKLGIT